MDRSLDITHFITISCVCTDDTDRYCKFPPTLKLLKAFHYSSHTHARTYVVHICIYIRENHYNLGNLVFLAIFLLDRQGKIGLNCSIDSVFYGRRLNAANQSVLFSSQFMKTESSKTTKMTFWMSWGRLGDWFSGEKEVREKMMI